MPRRRLRHPLLAFLALLSLLFSQAALARYVCPAQADPLSMSQWMAAGLPCDGMDESQPALCHQHGAAAPQASAEVKVPAPTLPMIVQVLQVPLVVAAHDMAPAPRARAPELRPPPDPLFLATLRLRV